MDIGSNFFANKFQAHFRGTQFESVIVGLTIRHFRNERETAEFWENVKFQLIAANIIDLFSVSLSSYNLRNS